MDGSDKTFTYFIIGIIAVVGLFVFFISNNSYTGTPTGNAVAQVQQRAAPQHGGIQQATIGSNQGQLAPDFSLTTTDGQQISLSQFKGNKPVLLYFVATWCPNCRRDLASVQSVYDQYKDDVEFIAIGVDTRESAKVLSKYQQTMGLNSLTFAPGTGKVVRDYNVRYTTTKFGIDKEGTIAFNRVGAVSEADWHQMFQALAQ